MPAPQDARRPRRVALVGAGWVAGTHAEVLRGLEGVELVLVCDPDPARAQSLAKRFGIPRTARSIDEIRASEVDVAHVLAPPPLHESLVLDLVERGIAVFVEKPLALSAAGARALAEAAARRGVALGVNHNFVFHPAFAELLSRVRAGELGRVEHVEATLAIPLAQLEAGQFGHWMFAAPRNIVYEQAVHPLSLVHALLGPVETAKPCVLSSRELVPGLLFHDRWSVAARAAGVTADVHLAFGAGFERFRVEVRGTDGFLEADLRRGALSGERKSAWLDFFDDYLATSRRGAMMRRAARRGFLAYARKTLGFGRRDDPYFASMRDSIASFHAAVARGPAPTADRDVEVVAWCDAVAAAASPASPEPKPRDPGPARAGEVAVLGATGFIGRRTVAKLLERGLPVTAIVRSPRALPAEIARGADSGRVRVLRGHLEDPESLEKALAGAKVVLQLATGSIDTWESVERTMVRGSLSVAEAALRAGASRFVYVSSISALDTRSARPIEDSLSTDPRPESRSLYARGKIAAEKALVEMHAARGLPLVIVRPGVVLGAGAPFQHSGLGLWVRDVHCVGWGAGDHALPLVWVDDVAEALALVAAHPGKELDGRALDLAADTGLCARDVVGELRAASGRELRFHARPLGLSYAMEIGKWIVKRLGRRAAEIPSWRDLEARSLLSPIPSRTAREVLGWKPVDDREAFLERAVRPAAVR